MSIGLHSQSIIWAQKKGHTQNILELDRYYDRYYDRVINSLIVILSSGKKKDRIQGSLTC